MSAIIERHLDLKSVQSAWKELTKLNLNGVRLHLISRRTPSRKRRCASARQALNLCPKPVIAQRPPFGSGLYFIPHPWAEEANRATAFEPQLAARSSEEPARAAYEACLTLTDELGMRPLQALCHLGIGQLFAHTGERELAQRHLRTALAMTQSMEMDLWLERTQLALQEATR
jgi:hypothetical protein